MLKSNTLLLRAIEPEDLEQMYQWENNPEIWHLGRTLSPFSKYSIKEYIDHLDQDIYSARQLRFVIQLVNEQSKSIGYIDLYEFDPMNRRAGVGILIGDEEERRKQYANDALGLLIQYAFNLLHIHQLFCYIPVNNYPSIRLFTKNGFREAGIMKDWLLISNQWVNVVIMQLISEYHDLEG
ncbi:MAG: GNAT family N-acetyltransferase [Bacteroidia bacterium]|nr:GNAT family N-acetyltransferase [Bacteroidia bacterium]MCZ2277107.1 GNAT family N-acetyltransferase [Bacteroidia bacterium]